jgi:ubiquinone/menaquinone biosynthesis C-methylase UbiE
MADHTAEVRSFFDAEALEYVRERERQHSFVSQKKIVLEMLPGRCGSVLDVGCGPAVMEDALLARASEVWGIDASAQMIAFGQARLQDHAERSRCHLAVGDVERLEFADGFFDAIISMGVLEYVPPYDRALSEMHRVLRSGGTAVFTVPSRVSAYHLVRDAAQSLRACAKRMLRRPPSSGSRLVTARCVPWRLNRQLERAGFRRIEGRYCNFILYPLHELSSRVSLALNRRLSGLSDRKLGAWLGTQYIVKAQKR